MPRKPKPFSLYPTWILDVIQRMARGEDFIQMQQADRGTATSTCHMFNRGRLAFAREMAGSDPNLVEIALDIVARSVNLTPPGQPGRYYVEFTRRGLAVAADESRGSRRGMDSPLRELSDVDSLLKKVEQEKAAQEAHDVSAKEIFSARPAPGEDEHDKMLREMFHITTADERKKAQEACEHEWDALETHCVKCGKPYERE